MRVLPLSAVGVGGLRGTTPRAVSCPSAGFLARSVPTAYRERACKLFQGLHALCRFSEGRFLEEHLRCVVVEPFVLVTQKGGGYVAAANVQAAKGAVELHQLAVYEQGGIAIILVF